jgi:cytochrome c oxidase subunit IV
MAGHFIIPKKYYQGTLIALLILTVFTVAISRVDLGILNTPVALLVACIKTCFVGAFFMGLRWEKFNLVFVFSAVAAMALFFLLTFADILYRGDVTKESYRPYTYDSPVKLVTGDHHKGHDDHGSKKGDKH